MLPDRLSIGTRLAADGLRGQIVGQRKQRRGEYPQFDGERFYVLAVGAYEVAGWRMPAHEQVLSRDEMAEAGWDLL